MSAQPALKPSLLPPPALADPVEALLDPAWRPGARDADHRILLLARDDPWITACCCRVEGCDYQPRLRSAQPCEARHRMWLQSGEPGVQSRAGHVQAGPQRLCAAGRGVSSCQRPAASGGLCHGHAGQLRTGPWTRARLEREGEPHAAPEPCQIPHCPRRSRGRRQHGLTLCTHHASRAACYCQAHPGTDLSWRASAVAPVRAGALAFAGVTERGQHEILFGLRQARRHDRPVPGSHVRAVIEWIRDARKLPASAGRRPSARHRGPGLAGMDPAAPALAADLR